MKPILFSLGFLHIYSYGLMVALGVVLSLLFMLRRASRDSFPKVEDVYDLIFTVVVTGFLGARLYYVLQNFDEYSHQPLKAFAFWEGGLIFYGGMIAAIVGVAFFSKIKKYPFLKLLDFIFPFIALSHAFGRLGCFMNGCCHGVVCDLPWGVQFPHLDDKVHPTQLYEMIFNFLLFAYLYKLYPKKKFDGQITASYMMIYAVGRFVIEFWRAGNPLWLGVTWNQWISVATFIFGGIIVFYRKKELKG